MEGAAPGLQTGFLAQEVEPLFPNWVNRRADGVKVLGLNGFESITVKALQELRQEKDQQITRLSEENALLRKIIDERLQREKEMNSRIERLERQLN